MNGKRGNIYIISVSLFIVVLVFLTFTILMLNIQINSKIYSVKQDLFYIVQNSLLSLNNNDLALSYYDIDQQKLFDRISIIINKNYNGTVTLDKVVYNKVQNKVYIEVILKLKPIVFENRIKEVKLKIKDEVKLKLLEII